MQEILEVDLSKQMTKDYFVAQINEDTQIVKAASIFKKYLDSNHDYTYQVNGESRFRHDLVEVHRVLKDFDIEKTLTQLLAHLWEKQECDIQVLVGLLWNQVDLESTFRKTTAIELILQIFSSLPYVSVNSVKGKRTTFTTNLPHTPEIKANLEQRAYMLPLSAQPLEVTNNSSMGFYWYTTPLVLGKKSHSKPQNYAHINRINSVEYCIDRRLDKLTSAVFNEQAKVKKDGEWETEADIVKRYSSFKHVTESLTRQRETLEGLGVATFHYCHGYDTRGRWYPKAYEFNYQGIKFIKALVNFAHKEIIEPTF